VERGSDATTRVAVVLRVDGKIIGRVLGGGEGARCVGVVNEILLTVNRLVIAEYVLGRSTRRQRRISANSRDCAH